MSRHTSCAHEKERGTQDGPQKRCDCSPCLRCPQARMVPRQRLLVLTWGEQLRWLLPLLQQPHLLWPCLSGLCVWWQSHTPRIAADAPTAMLIDFVDHVRLGTLAANVHNVQSLNGCIGLCMCLSYDSLMRACSHRQAHMLGPGACLGAAATALSSIADTNRTQCCASHTAAWCCASVSSRCKMVCCKGWLHQDVPSYLQLLNDGERQCVEVDFHLALPSFWPLPAALQHLDHAKAILHGQAGQADCQLALDVPRDCPRHRLGRRLHAEVLHRKAVVQLR